MCARWAADHGAALADADPDMGGLDNRPADNWRSLYAIADMAGGKWPAMIRRAAGIMAARADARASSERYPEMLLADCRAVFAAAGDPDRMTTAEFDAALHAMTERPWASYGRSGKPITAQARGKMLSKFGVRTAKLSRPENVNAYYRIDFSGPWSQYLTPLSSPATGATRVTGANTVNKDAADSGGSGYSGSGAEKAPPCERCQGTGKTATDDPCTACY